MELAEVKDATPCVINIARELEEARCYGKRKTKQINDKDSIWKYHNCVEILKHI